MSSIDQGGGKRRAELRPTFCVTPVTALVCPHAINSKRGGSRVSVPEQSIWKSVCAVSCRYHCAGMVRALSDYYVLHIWSCDACGYRFEDTVCLSRKSTDALLGPF